MMVKRFGTPRRRNFCPAADYPDKHSKFSLKIEDSGRTLKKNIVITRSQPVLFRYRHPPV
jgi:hypothetical protein